MKFSKLTISIAAIAAIFTVGCSTAAKTVSEESLGLRKTDLYSESNTTGDKTQYSKTVAGTSKKIERAFENAPPMVPHDTEGMLPITIDNNQCKTCHVDSAPYDKTIPEVPKSHFTDYRPMTTLANDGRIEKEGKAVDNTSDLKTTSKSLTTLAGSRFNCSQCHAPQSEGNNVPQNVFKAEFRGTGLNTKSNLVDNINEGVK
jgi:cytochrome c-type protein NapB